MKKFLLCLIVLQAVVLRLYHLGTNPPAAYWDEASLGYNAYSISKSGTDEHGEFLPLDRFIAFGDYKPPGYIYAAVPSVAVFGLNEFAVRLPSALAGVFLTLFAYLLAKKIFHSGKLALITGLLTAVSPWSLHLSRIAFEANLAAVFNLAAVYFFITSRRKGAFLPVSMLFFMAAFYTFNANRIISPLMYVFLSFIYYRDTLKNLRWHFVSALLALILLLPSMGFLISRESRLRFDEVSIFSNPQPVLTANSRTESDGNSFAAKILHNRRINYAVDFLKHFTDNFTGRFLFTHGDVNPRLHVQGMGQLYIVSLPFLAAGALYLLLKKRAAAFLLLGWGVIAALPAGVARETPHALRIVSVLPVYQIITALGIYLFIKRWKKTVPVLLLTVFYAANIFYYLHQYHIHFPRDWSGEFQYGTRAMVNFVNEKIDEFDRVFVTPSIGRPYIFFAFYTPYPPARFAVERNASRDWYGFWDVSSLGKIVFSLDEVAKFQGRSLLVTTEPNLPENYRLLEIINNLSGDPVFYLAEKP